MVAGISAYGFLVVSARALGKEEYAPLSVLWALVFLAGPGFFLPLEQEVGRALAARRTRGEGGAPVIRRTAMLGAALLSSLVLVGVVLGGPITEHLFSDETTLLLAWLLALVGACAGHVVRGTLSGQGRFNAYARHLGGEALTRLLLAVILAGIGISTVGPFGAAVGLAPFFGIAIALQGQRGLLEPGPPAAWSEISTALAALLVGSVLAMALMNAGPLAVELLAGPGEEDEAGRFLAGLVIARIPLFLFQAVQAALLPKLAELAGAGRFDEFRHGLMRLLGALASVALVGLLGSATVGPFIVERLFGDDFELGRRTMALLALGSGAYMLGAALAQANIALAGHARMATAWAVASAGFVGALLIVKDDLFLRIEIAVVVSGFLAFAAQGWSLLRLSRRGARLEEGNLIEAMSDLAFEP